MKKLILAVFFLVGLGACSSKTTSFDETKEAQVNSSSDTGTTEEAGQQQAQAENEVQSVEDVDKAVDMGDQGLPDIEGVQRSEAVCRNDNDERTVQVIDTKEGHCGVVYTKFGEKKTVAFARYEMEFCDRIYKGIVDNLVRGGFDCGSAGPEPVGEMEVRIKGKETPVPESETVPQDSKVSTPLPDMENNQKEEGQQQLPQGEEEEQAPEQEEEAGGDDNASLQQGDEQELQTDGVDGVEQGQMIEKSPPNLEGSERSGMVCVRDDDERTVSVIDTAEGHCGVNYTKLGKKETKAYAKYNMSICDEVFNKIVSNLVSNGFECNGVGYSTQ